jgi:hypothetical protein
MIKSLMTLAIFVLLGASVLALPAFAPEATARETVALLPVRSVIQNCASQVWPNFDDSCLRNGDSGALVKQARLVTGPR